jgi:serine/threonine protein kinase
MLALEGRQLGNYDVIRRIRAGGMGAVYEGRQRTAFGRRVAIKVILGDYAADPDMRRRFAREARTIARLQHPHILPLIEFGEEQGLLYLVMPFIDGGTLTSYLRRIYGRTENLREALPFDLDELIDMYLQLLDAVEYAHDEGLVHRDIKSSNVLLELQRSGPPHVYLADFGLVRPARQADSQAGRPMPLDQVPGTPQYMAPEQTRGIVTTLTDIYALGVLLFQMLTGKLPYDAPDDIKVIQMQLRAPIPRPSRFNPRIPPAFDGVVRKAMAKRDGERFQTVAALREAVLLALEARNRPHEAARAAPAPAALPETPFPPDMPVEREPEEEEEPEIEELPPEDLAAAITLPDVTPQVSQPPRAARPAEPRTLALPMPEPLTIPRRQRPPAVPAYLRQTAARNTGEPLPPRALRRRRRRHPVSLLVGILLVVVAILLLLLLLARAFNIAMLPPGFPLLGANPNALITITVQSHTLEDVYLLTASPQVQRTDLETRMMPARLLRATQSLTRTTATTGSKTAQSSAAQGTLLFDNRGFVAVLVPAGSVFSGRSNVPVRLLEDTLVPARHNGQDGQARAAAQAVNPGAQGNIPAGDINQPCCGHDVQVSNPTAFSGGSDGSVIHIVAQADLDRVSASLVPQLEQQVNQQLRAALRTGEALAGSPGYNVQISSDRPVGAPGDQVRVQVSVSGTATAYHPDEARRLALALLSNQAQSQFGQAYRLRSGSLKADDPQVTQQGEQGIVYLSVHVQGIWLYQIAPQTVARWRDELRGTSSSVALAYLRSQAGVTAVQIHLPFGADHLPPQADEIQIVIADQ